MEKKNGKRQIKKLSELKEGTKISLSWQPKQQQALAQITPQWNIRQTSLMQMVSSNLNVSVLPQCTKGNGYACNQQISSASQHKEALITLQT